MDPPQEKAESTEKSGEEGTKESQHRKRGVKKTKGTDLTKSLGDIIGDRKSRIKMSLV